MGKPIRGIAWYLFAVVLLLGLGRAQAADESLPETARGQFERGIALADQGDYLGALQAFTDAYATRPHFAVLYNIGQAQVALGRPLEAAATLSRYLREGQDGVSPERRRHVEDQIKLLESLLVELDVATDPSGAVIHIDGRPVGRTPLTEPVRLTAGEHKLRAGLESGMAEARGSKAALLHQPRKADGAAAVPGPDLEIQPRAKLDPAPVRSGWRRALPYLLAGTGVAMGAGALGLYLWKRGDYERWQKGESALQSETPGSASYQARADENRRLADSLTTANHTIAGLAIAGGAMAMAGGSLLLFDWMSNRPSARFAFAWGGGSSVTAGCWYAW